MARHAVDKRNTGKFQTPTALDECLVTILRVHGFFLRALGFLFQTVGGG